VTAADWQKDTLGPAMECAALRGHEADAYLIGSAEPDPGFPANTCTVRGRVSPTVEFVVNLPAQWNGRLYVHGNGGYGGQSVHGSYGVAARARAVSLGFAAAFTNLGHDAGRSPGATWAHDNREAEIDYSYRALHQTTVAAKAILTHYYGREPSFAYFEGCSTGGGQGLKAAQRYPADFDGIAVGAPVFDFVGLQIYRETPLDADTVARLGDFIMARYDAVDGLADGVIDDPRRVAFRPEHDLPRSGPGEFSPAVIQALERIYAGPRVDGRPLYPGIPVGAEPAGQIYQSGSNAPATPESGWATRLFPDASGYAQQKDNVETWLWFLAFEEDDPGFDWTSLDLVRDLPRLAYMSAIMDVTSTDLSLFRERGGKVLMYHGWADTGVNPLMTAEYYDRVLRDDENAPDYFRLFMVPGMFHCRGGLNVDRFDAITPVIEWVERDQPPSRLTGSRVEGSEVTRTRPLCAYPQVARYSGSGSIDQAINFSCGAPAQ
jgi:feruloyl esterase